MEDTNQEGKSSAFEKQLSQIRKEKGLSQEALSRASGVSTAAISKYERGQLIPRADSLFMLAQALNVSMDDLYNGANLQTATEHTDDEAKKLVSTLYWLWKSEYFGYPSANEDGDIYMLAYRYKHLIQDFGDEVRTLSQYENPHLDGIEKLTHSMIEHYIAQFDQAMHPQPTYLPSEDPWEASEDPWEGRIPPAK